MKIKVAEMKPFGFFPSTLNYFAIIIIYTEYMTTKEKVIKIDM